MNGFTAVFRKELTQMLRDRMTLIFSIMVPIFELVLFGVIDMNAKNIPTLVLDLSHTQESRQLVDQFQATSFIRVVGAAASRSELTRGIVSGRAQVAIEIPPDYARNLAAGRQADVLVMIDGSDSTVANQALAATNGVVLQNNLRALLARSDFRPPVESHPVTLFNPDMRSANLLIPGLIAIILTFSGTILSAFAIVKERERGTLEQLMVTPVSPIAVVVGKILPYLGVAYLTLMIILFLMNALFQVPIHGSVVLLLVLSSVYLTALLSLGLLISSRAKTQVEAIQMAMGVLLPSVLLSGFIVPTSGLPVPLHLFSYLLPATHFIRLARAIVIRGAGFAEIWPSVAALAAITLVLTTLSARAFKKTVS